MRVEMIEMMEGMEGEMVGEMLLSGMEGEGLEGAS